MENAAPHFRTPQPHHPWASEQGDPPNLTNSWAREEHDRNARSTGLIPQKRKPRKQNSTKLWKQPPVIILNSQFFIIYSVPVAKNHQRCLALQFSFTYIFNYINHGYNAAVLTPQRPMLPSYRNQSVDLLSI